MCAVLYIKKIILFYKYVVYLIFTNACTIQHLDYITRKETSANRLAEIIFQMELKRSER